jgi:hypothetical protein
VKPINKSQRKSGVAKIFDGADAAARPCFTSAALSTTDSQALPRGAREARVSKDETALVVVKS